MRASDAGMVLRAALATRGAAVADQAIWGSGWRAADGSLYFTASAIAMLVAVVRLPSIA